MVQQYFLNLSFLWSKPTEFFEKKYDARDEKEAFRFANITGVLVALELGVAEIFSGGSITNVALVTLVMLLGMPFFVNAWIYLWSGFMKLCASMLGETLPLEPMRQVVAYSVAGISLLGIGYGLGKWLALATFFFQVLGIEKVLRCSRWTAGIYVGLPFSLVAVLTGFVIFMFKVFK
jgi:hypothetical protein